MFAQVNTTSLHTRKIKISILSQVMFSFTDHHCEIQILYALSHMLEAIHNENSPTGPYGILPKAVSATHLLHNPSLPLRKRRVPPQFVIYVLHLYLDATLGLFSVGWGRLLGLKGSISIVCYVGHGAVFEPHALRRPLVVALV